MTRRILFVHQNFPGQYRYLATALAAAGNEVVALGMRERPEIGGIRYLQHVPDAKAVQGTNYLLTDFAAKVARGMSAARCSQRLQKEGFHPDIVLGHHGWGETLFLKDVWPNTKLLSFCEYCYSVQGADVGFDPEFPLLGNNPEWQIRLKNAPQLLAMQGSDWLITPTKWQARQIPSEYHARLSIIHDGIDTKSVKPNDKAFIFLGRDQIKLSPGDEVISFVNRNLEPYRGYHKMMRALPSILKRRPNARIVIVGGNKVSYGSPPKNGQSYKQMFLEEVRDRLDLSRIHFVGNIKFQDYIRLLQVSAAHVYLTYPFVLSWSLIEALAAGCCVIASDTPPVTEIVNHGENGILVDFHSEDALVEAVIAVLSRPGRYLQMRANARRSSLAYDVENVCMPRHLKLIDDLISNNPINPDLCNPPS